jgi:hemerythrin superfamily protein
MKDELSKAAAKAAGMAKGAGKALAGQTGILRHLAAEHAEVSLTMKRIADAPPTARTRDELFPGLKRDLLAHAKAEEKVFYPALRSNAELAPLVERSLAQHRVVEELLGRLATGDKSTSRWIADFESLMHAVEEHVELEENRIFPEAKDVTDGEQRSALLDRFEREEEAWKKSVA